MKYIPGAAPAFQKWSGQEMGVTRGVTYPTTVNFLKLIEFWGSDLGVYIGDSVRFSLFLYFLEQS